MAKLCLSIIIDLPDDLFEAAKATEAVRVPWHAALQNLKDANVPFQHSEERMDTRTKAKRKPRARVGAGNLPLPEPPLGAHKYGE